jgi:hypothetical protein
MLYTFYVSLQMYTKDANISVKADIFFKRCYIHMLYVMFLL